ncbi:unnamed protein product [Orchesella dallaii]|uniref:F-box domain-containing protein n=1 Tax=Orchesella dallaii TaxID=48710 RepID=A0ABP1RAH6_9HEXA
MEVDEEDEVAGEHPLTNDLVLQEIVKYIRQRDIPRCRQVCKKWNQTLIPRMRSEIQVKCLDQASFGKLTRLAKFLSVMESSHDVPFGNYLLLNLNMSDPLVEKFFTLCGLHIHTLRVQFMPNDIDICSLRELLLLRAPAVVNLSVEGQGIPESVTNHPTLFPPWSGYYLHWQGGVPALPFMESIQFKTEEGQKCHPGFLCDLFKGAVNLKSLTFLKYSDPTYSIIILSALHHSENYLQLKSIHMERLCEAAFQILINMSHEGMQLKDFSFQSLAEDVKSSSLEQLISCHKESLESLYLNEVMGTKNLQIRLPSMANLRKLTRSAICSSQIPFGPICYAKHLPNLEELSVFAFADELDWNEYFSETVNWIPCISLRKLELPINLKDLNRLRRLCKMFPSVTKVIVSSPADEIIPLMWELWPELEELHLSLTDGNSNIDSLFTGIPQQECVTINAGKTYGEVDIERIRIGPSIAYLRGLKKLNLEISPKDIFSSFCLQNKSCLPTDITGYFGLAYLSNLEDLMITSSEISKECAVFLLSKFQKFANVRICDSDGRPIIKSNRILC